MQPRYPFPGVPPGVPGVPPGVMPPAMPGFPPPPGYPGFYPPAGMPMPPPPHMMHPGMPPAHLAMPPNMPPVGMPPPPVFNPPAYAAPAPVPPPKPATASSSVIVGAPVMRVAAAAPPTPVAGAVIAAPPVPAPAPVPIVMVSANSAIHDFNYSNPSAVFLSATSTLVNKHIFQNPAAALPLTVYVGQVPMDMPEAVLMKILESCGKLFKLTRPVDPATQLPAAFALATYSQGLCALRCVRALNGYLVDEEEDIRLVVKTGTKETVAVESIMKAEDEASAELPEGHSLERDIYDAIRANVADTLTAMRNPVPVGPVATLAAAGVSAGEAGGVSANPSANHQPVPPATRPPPPTTKRPDAIEAGEIPEDGEEPSTTQGAGNTNDSSTTTPIGAAGATGNYYNRLDGLIESANSSGVVITATLAEQVAVDEAGEKMLMSEIERFRLRQLQRDKEKEEERKMKVKQKMQEMKELAQRKAEREARALAEGFVDAAAASFDSGAAGPGGVPAGPAPGGGAAGTQADATAANALAGGKRRSEEVSAEELEIKRRRKLQVLQMLAGGAEEGEVEAPTAAATEEPTPAPTQATAAAAAGAPEGASTGAPVSGVGLATKRLGVKKAAPGRTTFTAAEDEENAPKKAMILLDYTEEELREMAQQTQQYLAHPDDFDSLEDDFSGKKRNLLAGLGVAVPPSGAPDISSIQAKVRAQAQAISAALALKIAQGGAAAANPSAAAAPAVPISSSAGGAGAGAGVDKSQLKTLVDRIPTEKDELFAYPLNWAALDAANIVTDVMAAWVSTKIAEYLGEEEPQLRDFIVGKLRAHCRPSDLLEELAVVMDEAAEPFVVKLWRMLVYYSVKNA